MPENQNEILNHLRELIERSQREEETEEQSAFRSLAEQVEELRQSALETAAPSPVSSTHSSYWEAVISSTRRGQTTDLDLTILPLGTQILTQNNSVVELRSVSPLQLTLRYSANGYNTPGYVYRNYQTNGRHDTDYLCCTRVLSLEDVEYIDKRMDTLRVGGI